MDIEKVIENLSRYLLKTVEFLEGYMSLVNWAYVGFTLFGILFIWMVIDSMLGSQISPMFLVAILVFLLIFFLFAMTMSDSLKSTI